MILTQQQKDVLAAAVRFYLASCADDPKRPNFVQSVLPPILTELEGGVACGLGVQVSEDVEMIREILSDLFIGLTEPKKRIEVAKALAALDRLAERVGNSNLGPGSDWSEEQLRRVVKQDVAALRSKEETTKLRKEEGTQGEVDLLLSRLNQAIKKAEETERRLKRAIEPSPFDSLGRWIK